LRVIDLHAHLTPQRFQAAIKATGMWHGLTSSTGELEVPGFRRTLTERLSDMDGLGVDVQVVSPNGGFYQYQNEPETTAVIARDCNDEIAEMCAAHPDRFAGLATLPMQDIPTAVIELTRVMGIGFKGAMVNDHINGRTFDEPEFLPFWEAAERLGAIVFFHQANNTVVTGRIDRYHLDNSVGNLTERALTFVAIVGGGIIDRFPKLKILLGHAGGYTAFGIARMDRAWKAARELVGEGVDPAVALGGDFGAEEAFLAEAADRGPSAQPPSAYLRSFHYDSCTYTPATLRFLVDTVGDDRVVLGTDYPAPMILDDAVNWINGLDSLTADQKESILSRNPARLLGW
jgi:aminocarboxymuconate-semialdehyde decarboxylase